MTETLWHYIEDNHSAGPVSRDTIITMIENGKLPAGVLVWTAGTENWLPAREVFGLAGNYTPPPLPIDSDDGWSGATPHPWRRYFARSLDVCLNGFLGYFILFLVMDILGTHFSDRLMEHLSGTGGKILDAMITVFLSIFATAAMIGYTGSSAGKWLFGIRVSDAHGHKLGYGKAFKRELLIWMRGFGFGIPLVSLVTLIMANNRLMKTNTTSWDQEMNLRVICGKYDAQRKILCVVGVVLVVAMRVLFRNA